MRCRESEALLSYDTTPQEGLAETALLSRARQGDTSAFEELYVRYRDQTYTLCLGLCADREEAQDLLQETFVRAYRALPKFRGDAQLATWLHRITVNLYRDSLRRRRPDPVPLPEQAAMPSGPSPETVQSVREALAQLLPHYRTVLSLRYSQSLSYQEIADTLQWSLPRVKITLHRAKLAFKAVYPQEQGGDA